MIGLIIGVVVLALALVFVAGGIYLAGNHSGPWQVKGPSASDAPPPVPSGASNNSGESWTIPINTYCRTVDQQLKAVPQLQTAADPASALHQTADILRGMNSRLRGMPVPQEHRSDFNTMLAAWEQVPPSYDDAATAAAEGDEAGFKRAMNLSESANGGGNTIANRLGLTDCADAGGLPGSGQPTTGPTGPVV